VSSQCSEINNLIIFCFQEREIQGFVKPQKPYDKEFTEFFNVYILSLFKAESPILVSVTITNWHLSCQLYKNILSFDE